MLGSNYIIASRIPKLLRQLKKVIGTAIARGKELNESILGIIGYGRLGQKLAKYALAFNMKILVNTPQEINDPEVEFCELETLLRKSDIVSLQVDSRQKTIICWAPRV